MKLKQLPIVILLSMTLSGCTNTTFNKSMDAAENALANKEFEKASGLLELALQEKENDEDAKLLKNQIDELINIKELSLDEKFDEVIELCNELKSRSNINDIILSVIAPKIAPGIWLLNETLCFGIKQNISKNIINVPKIKLISVTILDTTV